MSTQKKINRPSDDPVVAIRALRLRSNVNEITQYYGKNIPDAESWLNVTEAGLKNLSQIMTNMITRVDEDEEAINLVKYQNGYNLACKMVQTLTEVYDRLILQTGV